jgi:class 3 adenylate cyclase/tetratricopeptide (TPR) repeat protein
MNCPACGSENSSTRKFCRACGASLAPVCPQCGSLSEPGDRFCGECGTALAVGAPAVEATVPSAAMPGMRPDYLSAEERRPVTILFADIAGFTSLSERLDAEDVRDLTTECFRRLVNEATALGGMVDKFIGDAVMVLFGAPTAHEDDPVRAARAALAMQRALEQFNAEIEPRRGFRLALRIGIESGEVVTGLRDVSGVREYTAIGDAVNVAARLQSATEPGTIMIGPNTERSVRRLMTLEAVDPLHLKGKADPIPAWLIKEDSGQSSSQRDDSSPFVGRADELKTFHDRLDELRRGRGQILAVIGDPGLGKSRLLSEARSATRDLTWWRATAVAHEDASSHSVTRSVLAQLCSSEREAGDVDEAIVQKIGSLGFKDQLPLITRVLALRSSSAEAEASEGSATEAAQLISQVVQRLLDEQIANHPSVIEIDDLHWADPSSVQLLTDLLTLTERMPLMLCLAFRPERDAPIWQLREHAARYLPHRFTEIHLQPLTSEAAGQLAACLLGTPELPASINALLERAAGTPLWLEELIRTLQERGVVTGEQQGGIEDLGHLEIPDTLQGLIIARLDRLGEARVTLQTASVIGRRFAHRVLSRVAEDGELDTHLTQAQRADLVRELAAIPEREYGFKHVLVQEATYSTLLMRRRRELHRLVATALSELYGDHLETLRPMLAFHYERAEEWEAALDQTMAAANDARAAFANREALTHFISALGLAEKASRPAITRMTLLRERAAVHNDLGDFDAARADFEAARVIAISLQDRCAEAEIVGHLAMLWSGHRDYEEGLRLAETAVELARQAGSPKDLAQAYIRVATVLLNMNREGSCQESLEAALEIFRSLEDADGEAKTLDLLGMSSFIFGRPEDAKAFSSDAIARLRATGNRWTESSSAIVQGISCAWLGEKEPGLGWVEYALKTWTEMDSVPGISFAHSCISEVLEPYGDFQTSLEHARQGLEIARRINHLEWQVMGLWQLGRVYRACALYELSADYLREMDQIARTLQSHHWLGESTSELGATLCYLGNPAQARKTLESALSMGSGIDMCTFEAGLSLARLTFEEGDYRSAYQQAQRITQRPGGFHVFGVDASTTEGLALWKLGNPEAALDVLRTALLKAESWGVRPAEWRLRLAIGRVLTDRGEHDDARLEGQRARELIQRTLSSITDEQLRAGLERSAVLREASELAGA